MDVLIVDNGTKHLGRLKQLLAGHKITTQKLFSRYENIDKHDLILLSGGSQLSIISAPEVFKEEFNLVKNSIKPIIGICQGCEIIAKTYGSVLEYSARKSKGMIKIDVIKNLGIFGRLQNFKAYEAHHFAIKKLGKDLEGLARSKSGFEVIKHKNKKIYGLQFHPEMYVNKTFGDDVFLKIVAKAINKNS